MKKDIMKNFEKISNRLNELLIKNYDAEQGYIKALQNVENDKLKSFFTERSEDRGKFASQIRTQILMFGETPKLSGSFTRTMNKNWMDFETLFMPNDKKVILEEIVKGEKASLEDYNEIISETDIPENIMTVLVSHRNSIKKVINTVQKSEGTVA